MKIDIAWISLIPRNAMREEKKSQVEIRQTQTHALRTKIAQHGMMLYVLIVAEHDIQWLRYIIFMHVHLLFEYNDVDEYVRISLNKTKI